MSVFSSAHGSVIDSLLLATQLRHQRPLYFPGYLSNPSLCLTPQVPVPLAGQWRALLQSVDLLLEEIM